MEADRTVVDQIGVAVAMTYWSLRSGKSGARIMYVASACLLSRAGLITCIFIAHDRRRQHILPKFVAAQ